MGHIAEIVKKVSTDSILKHRVSRLFQPMSIIPKDAQLKRHEKTSNSQRLMSELGVIKTAINGCYHFLPLGVKSLEKLTKIVDEEMCKVDGQKVIFPTLISRKLWDCSGRIKDGDNELFQLKDRHQHSYILGPTHEEVAAEIFGSMAPMSYKCFPLRLYQISNKYRDEMKPRFGLMRCRQFLMKDLYTFDTDVENAMITYNTICDSYESIFNTIGVPFVKVRGASGNMGGSLSHEFHFTSDIGEDEVSTCGQCSYSANTELFGDVCPECQESKNITRSRGIEVGHTFLLGKKYSKPLKAQYLSKEGKPVTLEMGSYGLGLSRILAASIEVLSSELEMRWPDKLVPYNIIIIPPKSGSKEEKHTDGLTEKLYTMLDSLPHLHNNVLVDDRTSLTIGKRFLEAKRFGYPYILVIGQTACRDPPTYEINDLKRNTQLYLSETQIIDYIRENVTV